VSVTSTDASDGRRGAARVRHPDLRCRALEIVSALERACADVMLDRVMSVRCRAFQNFALEPLNKGPEVISHVGRRPSVSA
jgi:hypothetical protein